MFTNCSKFICESSAMRFYHSGIKHIFPSVQTVKLSIVNKFITRDSNYPPPRFVSLSPSALSNCSIVSIHNSQLNLFSTLQSNTRSVATKSPHHRSSIDNESKSSMNPTSEQHNDDTKVPHKDSCGVLDPNNYEPEMVSIQNPETGEIGGPRGKEPTRYGDWEAKGRCWDF